MLKQTLRQKNDKVTKYTEFLQLQVGYTIGRLSYKLLLVIDQVSDRGPQVLE